MDPAGIAMLEHTDRNALSRWCQARRVRWFAATTGAGVETVLLAADTGGWPLMRLVRVVDGWLLETETGEPAAASSDLLALLDAMDAGIVEFGPLPIAHGGVRHSPPATRKAAGSAMT